MNTKKNGLRFLFLAMAFLAYEQPSSAWAYCSGFCSGYLKVTQCAHYEAPYSFDCQIPLAWVDSLEDACEAAGRAVGDPMAWFELTYCSDAFGEYSTYCSYYDPSCAP